MNKQRRVLRYQEKYTLAEQLRPQYHTASRAQKTLFLDAFVKATGYTRKSALRLLHHPRAPQRRPHASLSGLKVQEALMLAWKATYGVCAKRLIPFIPVLLPLLERGGHVHLLEEDRQQLMTMSISTAERVLKNQPKPGKRNLSATTPGPLAKSQIPVCLFAPWEEDRPGFVEVDLVAHGGETLDGRFLFTMTLTDLATGWTECVPLFSKHADAVVAGLSLARVRFPFPLLGIDTDCGAEFLNEKVVAYCREHHLTFTRGRPYTKTDLCHVEQKNGAVVRRTVGDVRLEGAQAYMSLHEVYRVVRLMVNGFQPSVKLQEKRCQGDHVRRVYDVAQTPLQRLLASGLLSDSRQQEVSEWFEHLDPLALSERLDAALQTLWSSTHRLPVGGTMELLKEEPCLPAIMASPAEPLSEGQGERDPLASGRCVPAGESQQFECFQTPLEVAILTFLQERCAAGRRPATLAWHKSSLLSLERFLRKQGAITEVCHVSRETLQAWLADLRITPSVFTGKTLSVRSIATTARSARAFCNWLVQQGLLETSPFPSGGVPQTSDGEPRLVDSRSFARFLKACQSCKQESQRDQGMDARNRAMLWLLLETGLSVSDLCRLRLSEVDIQTGIVTVQGAGRVRRIFPLSTSGKEAVRTYVEQVRMTLTWKPGRSEDQEILLLTGNKTPLTTNTVTQVFARLNQRAGLEKKPICPSMLRETYAIRFLQAGGRLAVLQEQLGVRDSASVKRYERFSRERGT